MARSLRHGVCAFYCVPVGCRDRVCELSFWTESPDVNGERKSNPFSAEQASMPCSERDQCPDVLESDGEETASEAAAAQVREPKLSRPAYLSFTLSIVAIGLWVNQ